MLFSKRFFLINSRRRFSPNDIIYISQYSFVLFIQLKIVILDNLKTVCTSLITKVDLKSSANNYYLIDLLSMF